MDAWCTHVLPSRRWHRGFTLIELLIVVAIITVLSSIALGNYVSAKVKANLARARADMQTLATAIMAYQVDNGESPLTQGPFAPSFLARLTPLTAPISYITGIPKDPFQPLAGKPYWESLVTATSPREDWADYYLYNLASAEHGVVETAGKDITKRNGWSLTSAGPDRRIAFPYYYYGPSFARADYHLNFVYDPTNDLITPGEIFLRGGLPQK